MSTSWPLIGVLTIVLLVPVALSAAGVVAREAALRHDMSALEPADRSVTASIVDSTGQNRYGTLDPGVRDALAPLGGVSIGQVIYRPVSDSNGGGFVLGGVDGLAGLVRVIDGHLPTECRPARCEVVEVGTSTSTTFDAGVLLSSFGLVVVGRAERTNDLLLSGTFQPDPTTPLLVGNGTQAVASVAALSTHGRTYGWVVPVDSVRLVDIGVDEWSKRATATGDALARVHPYFVLTLPNNAAIAERARRAENSAERFRVFGLTVPLLAVAGVCMVAVASRGAKGRVRGSVLGTGRGMRAIAIATLLAAALGLAICGLLAARSPLGLNRVARSAMGGVPAAGAVVAAAVVAVLIRPMPRTPNGSPDEMEFEPRWSSG
jgi:hypothetical protein